MPRSFIPYVFLQEFYVSSLTLKSLIYFGLSFVSCIKKVSFFLHVNIQFS